MSTTLSLKKRTEQGHQAKSLRLAGLIPSVVYGGGDPILVSSLYNETEKALNEAGYHSPVELDIEGDKKLAIVKNISVDPVSRRIINVEFQAVSNDDIVEATAPITIVDFDQSEASKKHYVILQVLEEIAVKAKPSDLPEKLIVSGAKLADLGDKLTVAELQLPGGVELADRELAGETVIANVYDPAAEAEARDKADESAAAPAEAPAEAEAPKAE